MYQHKVPFIDDVQYNPLHIAVVVYYNAASSGLLAMNALLIYGGQAMNNS